MIPFGPFQPDVAGINSKVVREARNVLPAAAGFRPLPGPTAITGALDGACFGTVVVIKDDGSIVQIAGSSKKLFVLRAGSLSSSVTADRTDIRADSTLTTADSG